ncbi:hypothetical protein LCGC14_0608770 [marine sediment metagenome]|uniref:Uncharacterized protein n=1 Tax=marine sediment metagenome TaxID=412755 RepID=A0A0F9RSL7_9ZZZZ
MVIRKYIKYTCKCGWTRKYPTCDDPEYIPCPGCNKRNSFYKQVIEEKVKRGKVKKRR